MTQKTGSVKERLSCNPCRPKIQKSAAQPHMVRQAELKDLSMIRKFVPATHSELDCGKDLSDKPQSGEGPHSACNKEHGKAHQEHVPEVQHIGRDKGRRLQSSEPDE